MQHFYFPITCIQMKIFFGFLKLKKKSFSGEPIDFKIFPPSAQ